VIQYVTFVTSNYRPNAIRADFSTSANPLGKQAWRFAVGKEVDRWWHYSDDASLRDVVRDLVGLAVERGIPWLDSQ